MLLGALSTTLFPYTTLFRSQIPVFGELLGEQVLRDQVGERADERAVQAADPAEDQHHQQLARRLEAEHVQTDELVGLREQRSEEHTSELQSHHDLVCRLLLE